MSDMQGPDEGVKGAHLPHAAEVEMPEMRQSQDAEAEVEALLVVRATQYGSLDGGIPTDR